MGIGRIINNNNIIIILVYGCKVQTPPTPSFSISIYPIANNSVLQHYFWQKLASYAQPFNPNSYYLNKILA